VPAERRAAVIGGNARRQNQADAPARLRKMQRAFDKQLIAVRLTVALMTVGRRRSAESQLRRGHRSRIDPL
jgi:hypothetical protein